MYISPQIVVGFHGCDQFIADSVLKQGRKLAKSENDYDWLGHGIYFWEGDYERALEWAKTSSGVKNPAVIGAFIKLGNCVDLLDKAWVHQVKVAHGLLVDGLKVAGEELPKNKVFDKNGDSFRRDLDCRVMQYLQSETVVAIAKSLGLDPETLDSKQTTEIRNHPDFIDSVRGMFPEGDALYEGAGFRENNHIQLCIVNPNCIVGYFNPLKPNPGFKRL